MPALPPTLYLGRLGLTTALDTVGEDVGNGTVETVGPVALPGERGARQRALKVPLRGAPGAPNSDAVGRRLRRQARALLANVDALREGLEFRWAVDPETGVWLLIAGGSITDQDGAGPTFGDWELELRDAYVAGTPARSRAGRRLTARDRRLVTTPRDYRQLVFSTDLAAVTALPVHVLPPNSYNLRSLADGGAPVASFRPGMGPGTQPSTTQLPVLASQPDGQVVALDQHASRDPLAGDVRVIDRRLLDQTYVFGHSMNIGYGTDDPPMRRWPRLRADLRNHVGADLNYGVNGAPCYRDESGGPVGGFAWLLQTLNPGVRAPTWYPNQTFEVVVNYGLVDLALLGIAGGAGSAAGNFTPALEALRSCLSRARAVCVYPIGPTSDASFNFTSGTWSNVSATNRNSGAGYRTSTSGTVIWTDPAGIMEGQTITVGFVVPSSYGGANGCQVTLTLTGPKTTRTMTFTIDGATMADPAATASACHLVRRFTNLPAANAGEYTVSITVGSGVGVGGCPNYVQVEASEQAGAQLVTAAFQEVFPGGYGYFGIFPHQPNQAAVQLMNQAIAGVIQEFGPRAHHVWVGQPATYLSPTELSQYVSDKVHLSTEGNRRYELAVYETVGQSAEEVYGPDHTPQPFAAADTFRGTRGGCDALENGICRVRAVYGEDYAYTSPKFMLALDAPLAGFASKPGWQELGRILIYDQASSGGAWTVNVQLASAAVLEWTPERTVVRYTLTRSVFDQTTRIDAYVTLQRGWAGPRVELYTASGRPGQAGAHGLAVRWVPNTTSELCLGTSAAVVAAGDPGGSWVATGFPASTWLAFGVAPWQALAPVDASLAPVAATFMQAALTDYRVSDTDAYGGSARNAVAYGAPYGSGSQGYASVRFGVLPAPIRLLEAETYRNTGSGTTGTGSSGSARGGSEVTESQTSDVNATVKLTSAQLDTLGISPGSYQVAARVATANAGANVQAYAKFIGGNSQTSLYSAAPGTTRGWVALGEIQRVAGDTLELHFWRSSGTGNVLVDAFSLVPTKRRVSGAATYDGAADLQQAAFIEATATPVLTGKA